jgi:hypothetical protein
MSRIINKRCEICDTTVKYGQNWSRHLKTKKHLKNLKNSKVNQESTNSQPIVNQESTKSQPIVNQESTNSQPVEDINLYRRCIYCNKGYKHKQSYYLHIKHRCKLKPSQETTQIINNTTNNSNNSNNNIDNTLNQTVNNNNQITLNVYGQETIPNNFLTLELLEKLKLCNGDLSKTYLLLNDELYLKPKKNNNIKYTNIQSEYCQILSKNNDWILKRLLEVMNERGIVVKQGLEREFERIISEEGIKPNQIRIDPRMKQMQNMYLPMSKFEDNINEEDDEIKELYKKYQIELYNLKKSKKKINIH